VQNIIRIGNNFTKILFIGICSRVRLPGWTSPVHFLIYLANPKDKSQYTYFLVVTESRRARPRLTERQCSIKAKHASLRVLN